MTFISRAIAFTTLTFAAATGAAAPSPADWTLRVDRVAPGRYATKPQIVNVEGVVESKQPGPFSVLLFTGAEEGGNLHLQQNGRAARTQLVDPGRDGRFRIPIWLGKCRENAEYYRIYVMLFHQLTLPQQRVIIDQTSEKTDQIEEIRQILEDGRINLKPLKIATLPNPYHRVDPKGTTCDEPPPSGEAAEQR